MLTMGDVDFDPMCDPAKPRVVSFEEISAAAYRIKQGVCKTPCLQSRMSKTFDMNIHYKCEFLQYTGSFKERGARNALLQLSSEAKKRGVIAASLGNHSQGMSYHGGLLKIPTTVVMPVVAPMMKIAKCKKYGANVIVHGQNMQQAKHEAMSIGKQKNFEFINGYDHPAIIAGQGTVGLEILEQVPDVEAILVPCGGGGLLAGITVAVKHLKPSCFIYGIETDKCASMAGALKEGKPVKIEILSTLADGLAVALVGENAFFNCKNKVDKMITVTEDWTARAILRLVEIEKYVIEGGGATPVAAIMSGLVDELKGKNVVCILSGGNIDTTLLSRCLDRGLAADQRLIKFKVNIADSPGSIADLCQIVSSIGVTIKDVVQERAWLKGNIFNVRAKVICETRGPEHLEELRALIIDKYKECYFPRKLTSTAPKRSSFEDSLEDIRYTKQTPRKSKMSVDIK